MCTSVVLMDWCIHPEKFACDHDDQRSCDYTSASIAAACSATKAAFPASLFSPQHGDIGLGQNPLNVGHLVILTPDEVEAALQPVDACLHLLKAHPGQALRVLGCVQKGLAHMLLQQLPDVHMHLQQSPRIEEGRPECPW